VRSSGRISKEVPILRIGDDLGGTVFSERTKTVVLSLHGAGIVSKHKLSPEQELLLRCPERNIEAEIRVVGQIGSHNGLHTYGVAFVDPNLDFWGIEFPPVSAVEREMGFLSLACTSCKTAERIDDNSMEADICATNNGVMRFCKRCGSTTFWKPAVAMLPQDSPPRANSPTNGQMPLFPSASTPAEEDSPRPAAPAPPVAEPSSLQPSSSALGASESGGTSSYYSAVPESLDVIRGAAVTTLAPLEKPASAKKPADTEKPGAPGINRRKHPRVKVNYSACVRHPQRGEDIVLCEDMSKGGLRFKSRKQYYPQTLIEVAAPYQHGQPAIFVPAQIVYVQELPEQQLYRYGVQYLKPTKVREAF
jgi:hypothetical protein